MIKKLRKIAILAALSAIFFSCSDDNDPTNPPTSMDDDYIPIPTSPVNLDMDAFPFSTLSEYNLFEGEMKYICKLDIEPIFYA